MAVWCNDLCTTFMELYQMEPIIWNPRNPDHKDKNKVNDAWDRISKELNIGIQDLKTKKLSLMATFRGHLRRRKASVKSGAGTSDVYKPIWFLYELMESFLGEIYECLPTINTERQGNNSPAIDSEKESSQYEGSPMPESGEMPESPIASTSQLFSPQHPRRRAKGSDYLINEASKQMKETFNTLNSVLKDQKSEEDECDLYCKLLAKKLRGLPENERAIFMYEIDGMFINRIRAHSNPAPNLYIPHYIPQQATFSHSYSEQFRNNEIRILKRPETSLSYSEPPVPTKMTRNNDMPAQVVITPNHTTGMSLQSPPVLHNRDRNPVDNSKSMRILSDHVVASPASDVKDFINYSQE